MGCVTPPGRATSSARPSYRRASLHFRPRPRSPTRGSRSAALDLVQLPLHAALTTAAGGDSRPGIAPQGVGRCGGERGSGRTDSTALLQHATSEDAHQLIGVALERFVAVVQAAGGVVLRFMGDGLKAAFGAQGVREDEAERAVRAGLAILAAAADHARALQTTTPTQPPGLAGATEAQRQD